MKTPCCSQGHPKAAAHIAAGVVPGLILLLMPKCPACLAAYLAVGAGISLSMADAASLRLGLSTLCAVTLILLAASYLTRCITIERRSQQAIP